MPVADDSISSSLLALVSELCETPSARAAGWSIVPILDAWWIRVQNRQARCPAQGWKLHISATPFSVATMLEQAMPVLLAENANFKVIASVARLRSLNEGEGGLSQVGKCLTVYPNDDRQAVRLAVALDQATRGLRGPRIPSDRPLAPRSLVHYRYGSFASRVVQTLNGSIEWAIAQPDGKLIPDRRTVGAPPPEWAVDPFVAAGVVRDSSPLNPLIGERYLVVETLAQSARGTVARAVDLRKLRRCVLKRAGRDAQMSQSGQDARDRLHHEAAMLACLAPDVPEVFDLIACDDDLILVLEDVGGETLEQRVTRLSRRGCMLLDAQVVALGRALAAVLQAIHDRGFVYRDLKPSNIILGPDDRPRLIDVELAYHLQADTPPFGYGTRGYMSPQQARCEQPGIADDLYSLGAVLYFAATGAEPGYTPHPYAPLNRPLQLINPALGPDVMMVIDRCLRPDAADRPVSMAAVGSMLATGHDAAPTRPRSAPTVSSDCQHVRALARRLGDSLLAQGQPRGHGSGWESALYDGTGIQSRDLYAGSAGVLLTLAELVAEFGEPREQERLRQAASTLLNAPRPGGLPLGGLYFGEAGIALAALRAGQALNDPLLIAAADERAHVVAGIPYRSPDLMTGAAGRIRFHVMLWDETGNPEQLAYAVAAGDWLLATGAWRDDGVCWTIPAGYGSLSDNAFLGYAHGSAGIGDVLLDLFEATGEERFQRAAQAAAREIMRQAIPALNDGSGWCWPKVPGGDPTRAFWCHGAAGIGRFLLRIAQAGGLAEAAEFAEGAARTVARGVGWAGPTQCHGLAGSIEFLLDMFQAIGSAAYLEQAHTLARVLDAFIVERHGLLVCQSERPDVFTPDLMLGYGGVILCLLRLADPELRPTLISRAGFRYRDSRPA